VTPTQVLALRPPAASGYRLAWARERMQDTFWPLPAALPAAARVDPGEAVSVLGIIASATLTFLGVVFTLTLVVAATLLVFLGYVATTLRLLQVAWGITDVANRTRSAVAEHYPAASGYNLGRNRTLYQDPSYGLRQLVDIATQALSPAVNQPTTAVQVIDRLEDILRRICARPLLSGYYADAAGTVRFVEPELTRPDAMGLG
jgi:uncharacterized membrane protein